MCLRRLVAEAAAAFVVERELDDGSFRRRRVRLRVGEILTRDDRVGIEHVHRTVGLRLPSDVVSLDQRITLPGGSAPCTVGYREVTLDRRDVVLRDVVLAGHLALLNQLARTRPPVRRPWRVLLRCIAGAFFVVSVGEEALERVLGAVVGAAAAGAPGVAFAFDASDLTAASRRGSAFSSALVLSVIWN